MASVSDTQALLLEELRKLKDEVERLRTDQERVAAAELHDQHPKQLSEAEREQRESFAEDLPVPGRDAPTFNLVNDFLSLGVVPWADALVPAYLLDKNYRIVDWNTAFSVAFDRTMEGRRGQSVLEWVYFLDNYEQSLKQAAKDFADPDNLPKIHIETIEYTGHRYGPITAVKRAYQMPKDDGDSLGWLVTLEVKFTDLSTALQYKRDLFEILRNDMTWSEYALSYDTVLTASNTYPELLRHILGGHVPAGGEGTLTKVRRGSRVLDLGAGTGNVSKLLAEENREHVIFALENNRMMLDMLREKCAPYLRSDDEEPGVLAIKQDVNVLFGLPDGTFDCAILNNVAYALKDPLPCFRQVRQALAPDGEIRVSGPKKDTNLEHLFHQIRTDLESSNRFDELKDDFERVQEINSTTLAPSLYRWTVEDMKELLLTAGFREISYATDKAYAGQAMIVVAKK